MWANSRGGKQVSKKVKTKYNPSHGPSQKGRVCDNHILFLVLGSPLVFFLLGLLKQFRGISFAGKLSVTIKVLGLERKVSKLAEEPFILFTIEGRRPSREKQKFI